MYAVGAAIQGIEVIEVPICKAQDFQINYADLLLQWTPKVKLVFLCSPNNPTGNLLNPREIGNLCHSLAGKSIVVVDEAYIEFSDQESMTTYLEQYDNLVILRTFSKALGLAGARCGFLLANAEIIDWVKRIAPPYPLSTMVIAAVAQAISPARLQEVQQHILTIQKERALMFKALSDISYVKKVWASAANYLLIEVENAKEVMQSCTQSGFILRDMSTKPGLENCIRITIGKAEENKLLLASMQKL
jgi:histidinol-phosphate aminotransferase